MHRVENYSESLMKELAYEISIMSKPAIIGIAGGSSTGKSSLILPALEENLIELGLPPTIVSLDNFMLGRQYIDTHDSPYRWDDPGNFALDECLQSLKELIEASTADFPVFSITEMKRIQTQQLTMSQSAILLIEGLYVATPPLLDFLDYVLYIQSNFYARFMRRIFRFVLEFDIPKPDTAVNQMIRYVELAHHEIVKEQEKSANLTITVPYSFQETVQKYSLPRKETLGRGELLEGETIWNYSPEMDTQLCIKKGENYSFFIEYKGVTVYACEISEDVVGKIRSLEKDFLRLDSES